MGTTGEVFDEGLQKYRLSEEWMEVMLLVKRHDPNGYSGLYKKIRWRMVPARQILLLCNYDTHAGHLVKFIHSMAACIRGFLPLTIYVASKRRIYMQ